MPRASSNPMPNDDDCPEGSANRDGGNANSAEDSPEENPSSSDSDDPSEVEDDDAAIDQNHVLEQKLKELLDALQNVKSDDKENQKKFIEDYRQYLTPQPKKINFTTRNLPYRIADQSVQTAAWLVTHLAKEHPEHFTEISGYGLSAALHAIDKNLLWFLQAVLESGMSDENLKTMLGPNTEKDDEKWKQSNCIIKAINNKLEPSVIIQLIRKASEYTLAAQDPSGCTSLHHAVHYKNCTRKQLGVVEALIRYGDKAFDKRTGKPDYFSVYRYHVKSRPQAEGGKGKGTHPAKGQDEARLGKPGNTPERNKVAENTGKIAAAKEDHTRRTIAENKDERKHDLRRERDPKRNPDPISDKEQMKQIEQMMRHEATGYGKTRSTAKEGLRQPNQANQGLPLTNNLSPKGHAKSKSKSRSEKASKKPVDSTSESSLEVADEVAKMLKLHYLRTTFRQRTSGTANQQAEGKCGMNRDHNSAEEFLFGDTTGQSICFHFPSPSRKETDVINFTDFEDSFRSLEFDPVLVYVEFGPLELERIERGSREGKNLQGYGVGKRDMGKFFAWLSDKGVKTIIKVTVEDRKSRDPHGDETIIESLSKFEIEILDWRKIDLCPQVISDASMKSPNLREIHLRWSGNNAVLRAWSEPDGLAKLPQLEQIHLHEEKVDATLFATQEHEANMINQPRLDSAKFTENNIDEFEKRLKSARQGKHNTRSLQVETYPFLNADDLYPKLQSKNQNSVKAMGKKMMDPHQWLIIMDTFSQGIRNLKMPDEWADKQLIDNDLPDELRKEITVALIDDGVDYLRPDIINKLVHGKSFGIVDPNHDVNGAPMPYHGSTTGHGTLMANMIGRVCPAVKIFVCKLNVQPSESGEEAKFTAESAANAVEYAVRRGCDIISMSWTIKLMDGDKPNPNNVEHLKRLENALKAAAQQNILLFSSAPDTGSDTDVTKHYPFGRKDISNKFKIGAAKADGTRYSWASANVDFILPGKNVRLRKEDILKPEEDEELHTGSSVATALAAGLAALIVHCVKLGAIYNFRQGLDPAGRSEKTVQAIKKYDEMRKAFKYIGSKTGSGDEQKGQTLGVDMVFDKPGQDLDSSKPMLAKWATVAKLAQELMTRDMENTTYS